MSMFDAACKWLDRGVDLLPLQPQSKRIVAGYGPHLQHITDTDGAAFWFAQRACNLGLVVPDGLVVLDFDTQESYAEWLARFPVCAQTYTELTPRGAHVFLAGDSRSGTLNGGIEIKGHGVVVMSAPSVHPSGVVYRAVGQISHIQKAPVGFSLLSENQKALSRGKAAQHTAADSADVIGRIKKYYDLLQYAQSLTYLKCNRFNEYWHGYCPIADHKKSRYAGKMTFWIDTERVIWGCYACGKRGDVINLYAEYNHISVTEAIKRMAASL